MRFEVDESERVSRVLDDSPTARIRRAVRLRMRVGLVIARDRVDREALTRGLGLAMERPIHLIRYTRYTDLAEAVIQGSVDLAWLPPAVYAYVRQSERVRLVAAVQRSGTDGYRSALLARVGSAQGLDDLHGARAAWVDPWSAAGYLMPRAMIVAHGLDPKSTFASERFVGSYDAAIEALVARDADITGATCTVDARGKLVERSWSAVAPVRVLQISASIPSDVFCTTGTISCADAQDIEHALLGPNGPLIASTIGGTRLGSAEPAQYDALARAIAPRD